MKRIILMVAFSCAASGAMALVTNERLGTPCNKEGASYGPSMSTAGVTCRNGVWGPYSAKPQTISGPAFGGACGPEGARESTGAGAESFSYVCRSGVWNVDSPVASNNPSPGFGNASDPGSPYSGVLKSATCVEGARGGRNNTSTCVNGEWTLFSGDASANGDQSSSTSTKVMTAEEINAQYEAAAAAEGNSGLPPASLPSAILKDFETMFGKSKQDPASVYGVSPIASQRPAPNPNLGKPCPKDGYEMRPVGNPIVAEGARCQGGVWVPMNVSTPAKLLPNQNLGKPCPKDGYKMIPTGNPVYTGGALCQGGVWVPLPADAAAAVIAANVNCQNLTRGIQQSVADGMALRAPSSSPSQAIGDAGVNSMMNTVIPFMMGGGGLGGIIGTFSGAASGLVSDATGSMLSSSLGKISGVLGINMSGKLGNFMQKQVVSVANAAGKSVAGTAGTLTAGTPTGTGLSNMTFSSSKVSSYPGVTVGTGDGSILGNMEFSSTKVSAMKQPEQPGVLDRVKNWFK